MTTPKYKSDRTESNQRHPNAVHLKTLCTGCKKHVECYWPPTTTFGGEPCTAVEFMTKVLQSESVGIYCDDCMERMPDVKIENLSSNPLPSTLSTSPPCPLPLTPPLR